ncbi:MULTISPECIES: BCD family MFS transporter [unclassified Roseitalea]|uniref:BCD family MFS transporter n=1 Tax=unclassified Roseitalea TaxID=2639107 RepID=UPI00273D042E|nr:MULTISPECIES: BCD family MFS transporter [unclassified Roseitalea]
MFQISALKPPGLTWLSIVRLGLVQAALGSIVVLTTSTLNRVMVVELALAAVIPGLLVGLHYAVQIGRPLWGHASDTGASRTRWILGGLALLAVSGTAAAATTLLFEHSFWAGMGAALIAFTFIGFGIGASGTSLLALLASRTAPARRPAAATLVWMMMIAGIVVTAIVSSLFLDPYSHLRLVTITAISGTIAFVLAALGVWGIEARTREIRDPAEAGAPSVPFREALADVWHDPTARTFTLFVFVSMLAYQTQDLILEPFAGLLFGHTPGESTALGGMHHAGVFLGMAFVGIVGSVFAKRRPGLLKLFTVAGCLGSGVALALLALAAGAAPAWPLQANVFALGVANGVFAVAAIGTMMTLAGAGARSREGIRMGVWGAAQAIAFGLGGFVGTVAIDITRWLTGDVALSFAVVFAGEAVLFLVSAMIAAGIGVAATTPGRVRHRPAAAPLQPAE